MLAIFDCDGVLINPEAIFCAVDAEALTRPGHPTTAATIAERFAGVPHQIAGKPIEEDAADFVKRHRAAPSFSAWPAPRR
jgi:beta-phosphoglucomutase-like phosphatase (HAD superfamily)